jgi:NAD(P)-dependent dehydrogenase (short-subunit alcohol dehydrogenase family)
MDKKKTIFITGAAPGIGCEAALLFGKRDWFVGIFDLNEEALNCSKTRSVRPTAFRNS